MPEPCCDRREALLDAAERLFARKGYASVGIREIVESAGVNLAAIKYYFGSKRGLYLLTVRRSMRRRDAAAAWDLLQRPPRSRRAAAAVLVRFTHRFLAALLRPGETGMSGNLILREAAEPSDAIDSVVRDFIQPHESMLIAVIGVLEPEADDWTLAQMAQSVLGQILHYRVFRPFLERMSVPDLSDEGRLEAVAEHVARFSLRGLGCSPRTIEQAILDAREPAEPAGASGR